MSESKKDPAREFDDEFLGDPIGESDAAKEFDEEFVHRPLREAKARADQPVAEPEPNRADHEAEGVGYRRPPRGHQFKKGLSGNPRGRPKGTKNESTILKELLLERRVKIREGGRRRSVPVLEAMLLRFAEDSLKGDTKSAAFLLNRYGQQVSGEVEQPESSEDDREILEAFIRRAQKTRKGEKQ
jgi:Family of unknown function (DUF5681)